MNEISLKEYKESRIYFNLFDILIKEKYQNKESYLKNNKISISSYRRAKINGTINGFKILNIINNDFGFLFVDNDILDDYEKKFNIIANMIYYQNNSNLEDFLLWIEEKLDSNYLIFPILMLFKLFIKINMSAQPLKFVDENINEYNSIAKYKNFFNDELKGIYELIELTFLNKLSEDVVSKKYKNELAYNILSTKCLLAKRYFESIYFSQIVKNNFLKKENYKRVLTINLNLMTAYNSIGKYEEAYIMSKNQINVLKAFKCESEVEYTASREKYVLACLALSKFKEIIDVLTASNKLFKIELVCLLIAKYKIDSIEYEAYYNKLINKTNGSVFDLIIKINDLLVNNNVNIINDFDDYGIFEILIKILKKIFY